jgi:FkbM family methyltransferase
MTLRTSMRDLLGRMPMADGLFRRLVWSRMHFPEVELRFLEGLPAKSIDIAIDVGAALGSYTWVLNRKAAAVYAFEPGDLHGRVLAASIMGSRVTLERSAVGASAGTVSMYTPGSDTDAFHSATLSADNPVTASPGTQVRQVPQVSLDEYFLDKRDQGRHIDILKVDVEGYEQAVFDGAKGIIARHHPLVFCEIEKRHNAGYARVFQTFRQGGYRCYVYQDDGTAVPFDATTLDDVQRPEALEARLNHQQGPGGARYINNFIFQHPQSRVKVCP